jgi:hypothetical protein
VPFEVLGLDLKCMGVCVCVYVCIRIHGCMYGNARVGSEDFQSQAPKPRTLAEIMGQRFTPKHKSWSHDFLASRNLGA